MLSNFQLPSIQNYDPTFLCWELTLIFRLDALALSVFSYSDVAGWLAGCHTPVLYQNR